MVGTFFSLLVVMALVSICGEIVMRVRLTKQETSRDKLAWWRRGGDQVAATYEELFPHSHIPAFRRLPSGCSLPAALLSLCRARERPRLRRVHIEARRCVCARCNEFF